MYVTGSEPTYGPFDTVSNIVFDLPRFGCARGLSALPFKLHWQWYLLSSGMFTFPRPPCSSMQVIR